MFRRIKGKLMKEAKAPKAVVKDGHRLAVLRPLTEEVAQAALAEAWQMVDEKSDDAERFDKILEEQGRMTFVGLLGTNGRLLDPQTLADVGPLLPGDSFVSWEELLARQES